MKKLLAILSFVCLISASVFSAPVTNADGTLSIKEIDIDKKAVKTNKTVDGFKGVTVVTGKNVTKSNIVTIDLSQFGNKEIMIDFSCDIKIIDPTSDINDISWMINDVDANFPIVAREKIKTGEWTTMKGSILIPLGENKQLYLSSAGLAISSMVVNLKNLDVKISGDGYGDPKYMNDNWETVPSIKEAYLKYFDYFGIAVGWKGELRNPDIQKGLAYHATHITTGNEFKPDFLFNWSRPNPNSFVDFVAEDGNTYKMPPKISMGEATAILMAAKKAGLKLRGHVLVWHSQTPKFFFREGWTDNGDYVSVEEMTARQEWYIKYVLEWVKAWEDKYNNGERIITTWDVVNEAGADNAGPTRYTRENGDWWGVYHDSSYIVNAFRFANKYAPADVKLCYNDYGCASGASLTKPTGKHAALLKIIDEIQAAPDARIDVMGLQSHIGIDTKVEEYDAAIKNFAAKGVNVQITELDIGSAGKKYSSIQTASKYKEFMKMCIENRKTADKTGVEGITVWGLVDEGSWLNGQPEYKNNLQHPLLFKFGDNDDIIAKREYVYVMEAAQEN